MSETLAKTRTRALKQTYETPCCIAHGVLTFHADGTRVARKGRPNDRGTTAGMTADGPPHYQVVEWDTGATTHTSPLALAAVTERTHDAPETEACRKIAGAAWGGLASRVWAVQWTTTGVKARRKRYVHDVENRVTGERTSTLYLDADEETVKAIHFDLLDEWKKVAA
jgi:hypothetical protein